jgi:MFS family permease
MGIVTLNAGLNPIGNLVAGAASDLVGPRMVTLLLGSIAAAIAVIVFFASPTVREHRMSHAMSRARIRRSAAPRSPAASRPSTHSSPPLCRSRSASTDSRLDFPLPDGPNRAVKR